MLYFVSLERKQEQNAGANILRDNFYRNLCKGTNKTSILKRFVSMYHCISVTFDWIQKVSIVIILMLYLF